MSLRTWDPGPHWKPIKTKRVKASRKVKAAVKADEVANKRASKKRDGYRCRFPLCGCGRLRLALESSHWEHKGAGGDPRGVRSDTANLGTLCGHRHRDGAIAIDRGTLRPVFLTAAGYDGPIAWEIFDRGDWCEVAREAAIGKWLPFTVWQLRTLEQLAEMDE